MKVLGYILEFFINPFAVLLGIDVRGKDLTKYKWLNITLAIIVSIAISAILVYLTHKFVFKR